MMSELVTPASLALEISGSETKRSLDDVASARSFPLLRWAIAAN